MKLISTYIALTALLFTACNKDDTPYENAIQIVVNGYNGSNNELEIQIDTTRYDNSVAYGKYALQPASLVNLNIVYTFPSEKRPTSLTIKDPATGHVVSTKTLPATGTKAALNFVYLDGKELEVNPPAADPATNKLGFYVQYTDSDAPFDIFLYRMDNTTGQEYRQYLAKNVKPGAWIYADYLPLVDFGAYILLANTYICFTKTGTTDQWAFHDDENRSKLSASGMSFPITGDKGLVQPYFVAPGAWQLEQSRMFFSPDRPW